jgi:prepilin-type N-terminal cleavage/methylation domain-containing protein
MRRRQRGVTLIELLIAVTLVAALSAGMLMAIRVGLLTLEKTDHRLDANRRVVAANRILYRQLGGAMPVIGACGLFFRGDSQTLRLVSSYSLTQGARGAPHVLEMAVIPSNFGGVRLIVNETPYMGPSGTIPFCGSGIPPPMATPLSFVLADKLAYCRIVYKDVIKDSILSGPWLQAWTKPMLPAAVRIEMAPLVADPASLPLVDVTVPMHVNREVLSPYVDSWR